MTNKLREWLEIVGLFSVVASLVFVGLQMKQSHEIALSQASQARTAMSVETIVSTAENSHFVSALAKGRKGEDLSPEEQAATSQYAIAILVAYEDQYFQYINGFLTEERWQATKVGLKRYMRDSSTIPVRRAYERVPARYSSSFQVVVDGLISDIDGTEKPN
jgi:hypothetical protein